jgi:hypothetical protein
MSDTAAGAQTPSVRLSSRYLFTDDAIIDAMQLVTALTQLGHADRVKESIAGVMRAKRALATEKWTRTAETEFWTSFGRLAHAARDVGVLNGPVPEPVQANGFVPWMRKLVTFPGAIVVFVSLIVMIGWLWAKTVAETVDGERVALRGCLVADSEAKSATDVATLLFAPKSDAPVKPDDASQLAACGHILVALEGKLGKAQRVADLFYQLPNDAQGDGKIAKAPCTGGGSKEIFCQWMFAYNAPANDALGKIVQVFALFILPPLLGAMGAWSYTIRQMIRSPAADVARSRLGDRRHWLNMMFGAMLGSGFALWTTATGTNGPPGLFASMPPFIAAFIAGYGRDFVFAWIDEILQRAAGRGSAASRPASEPAERPERARGGPSGPNQPTAGGHRRRLAPRVHVLRHGWKLPFRPGAGLRSGPRRRGTNRAGRESPTPPGCRSGTATGSSGGIPSG